MPDSTIIDVARLANVSKTTVSRVLNGSTSVSSKTFAKVQRAIAELRYSPSAAARTLSNQQSNILGVLMPDNSEYFFGHVLKGINEVADEYGMAVMLCNSYHTLDKEKRALQMIKEQRVCGLIVTPVSEHYALREQQDSNEAIMRLLGVPMVFVDRRIRDMPIDTVMFDNYAGGYMAAKTLAETGLTRIGGVVVDLDLELGRDRLRGFQDGLRDSGLKTVEGCFITEAGQLGEEQLSQISQGLIERLSPGGAVFLSNGFLSRMFLREVFARNLTLGQDIHCIAFDRIETLEIMNQLKFSYIERSEIEMGRLAARMLIERVNGESAPAREIVIPAKLNRKL